MTKEEMEELLSKESKKGDSFFDVDNSVKPSPKKDFATVKIKITQEEYNKYFKGEYVINYPDDNIFELAKEKLEQSKKENLKEIKQHSNAKKSEFKTGICVKKITKELFDKSKGNFTNDNYIKELIYFHEELKRIKDKYENTKYSDIEVVDREKELLELLEEIC